MRAKVITIFIGLLAFGFAAKAQTAKTIDDMAAKHQARLDTGIDMYGTTLLYYNQMDSMLNMVYQKLRASLDDKAKDSLKRDELAWLKERDKFFKEQDKNMKDELKKGEWGTEPLEMFKYQAQADFVKERVLALIARLNPEKR